MELTHQRASTRIPRAITLDTRLSRALLLYEIVTKAMMPVQRSPGPAGNCHKQRIL